MRRGKSIRSPEVAEVVSGNHRLGELARIRNWVRKKARRQLTAAHALACYRCCLPALAGFTGLRCAGPAPDLQNHNIPLRAVFEARDATRIASPSEDATR